MDARETVQPYPLRVCPVCGKSFYAILLSDTCPRGCAILKEIGHKESPPSDPDKEQEPGRDEGPCTHPDNPTGGCNPECNYFEHETNETEGGDCQWHNEPDVDVFWVCTTCSEILGRWTEIKKPPFCQKCGTASTLDERSMPTQEDDPVEHKPHSDHNSTPEDMEVYLGGE